MSVQTAYSSMFSDPRPGSPADFSSAQDFITGVAQVVLPFGVLACEDLTNPGQFVLPAAAGDLAKNPAIVVSTMAIESRRDSYPASYAAGDVVNLLKQGRVWVFPEQDVVDGDSVYVRITANGAGKLQLGALRKDNDGGNASLLAGAKWRDTRATAAGVVSRISFSQIAV